MDCAQILHNFMYIAWNFVIYYFVWFQHIPSDTAYWLIYVHHGSCTLQSVDILILIAYENNENYDCSDWMHRLACVFVVLIQQRQIFPHIATCNRILISHDGALSGRWAILIYWIWRSQSHVNFNPNRHTISNILCHPDVPSNKGSFYKVIQSPCNNHRIRRTSDTYCT